MTPITHALAPVIIVKVLTNLIARRENTSEFPLNSSLNTRLNFSKWDYLVIGLAGALADLINPHIYLKDRLTSWSHGLPFWLLFSVTMISIALITNRSKKLQLIKVPIALCASFAYLLHLLCDAITGGINLLYPLQTYYWGLSLIPFKYWIPLDLVNLVIIYALFRRKKVKSDLTT